MSWSHSLRPLLMILLLKTLSSSPMGSSELCVLAA